MQHSIGLAFFWALFPLLPAILSDALAGSPYTDLYPAVWSIWATWDWFTSGFTSQYLAYPAGQHFYPSTMILGLIAKPLFELAPIFWVYNFLLLSSRFLGIFSFYLAGKAFSGNENSARFMMVLVGCSPFVHGFSVEGIIEGTQIWPIGLWLWAVARQKIALLPLFFFLTLLSNWYYGAVICLLSLALSWNDRKVLWSILGFIPALPFVGLFLSQLSPSASLPLPIIQQMGFQWGIPTPNLLTPANPFAISTYLGWLPCLLLFRPCNRYHFWIALGFLFSLGLPVLYQLPIFELFRFPYRWHLATLIFIGLLVVKHPWVQNKSWLSLLLLLEYLFLSPIDIFLPQASAAYPEYLTQIDDVVLDIPGPLYRKPGEINPSRPRSQYLLYYQTKHQQPTAWTLDFNGLMTPSSCFGETRLIDPRATTAEKKAIGNIDCWKTVKWVVVHNQKTALDSFLTEQGFEKLHNTVPILWRKND